MEDRFDPKQHCTRCVVLNGGVVCPYCGCADTRVSHITKKPGVNRRRRICESCKGVFQTEEKI